MAAETLAPDVEATYTRIIDEILRASDLNTISAKRIRKGLQERLDKDISHQKDQVTELIMKRFDKFNSEVNGVGDPEPSDPIPSVEKHTNGATTNGKSATAKKRTPDDDSALSELEDSPPKKKPKKSKKAEVDDAAYAAQLQAEENLRSRARSTRGGNTTKKRAPLPKNKKTKKKSANRIKDEDDSNIDSASDGEKKSPKRTGGFHKPLTLSAPLSELLGETSLSRPQTVKKIWEYVKERDLQDPNDKRQIRCDDSMRKVFKQDRISMFQMNKILSQNLYNQDE